MAKRKESVDLQSKKITFLVQNREYKALRFHPSKMTLDIMLTSKETDGLREIPFAHIPKEIKKIIKPN